VTVKQNSGMNYDQVDEMIAELNRSIKQFEATREKMQQLSKTLEEALKGEAGDAFVTAVRSDMCGSIDRLSDRFKDLRQFVETERSDMWEFEQQAKRLLGNNG
jgi:cell division septum initiation protein DivIVA